MRALVVILLVACGSSPPPPRPHTPTPADPHASRDAMVRASLARLAAGDAQGLIALADGKDAYARGITCADNTVELFKREFDKHVAGVHQKLSAAAASSKGRTIEVLEIEAAAHIGISVRKDEKLATCTAKVDLDFDVVKVKVRVKDQDGARELTVPVSIASAGDRVYLAGVPESFKQANQKAYLDKLDANVDTACACQDMDCVTKAAEEFGKSAAAWAKDNPSRFDSPSDEERARSDWAMHRLMVCVQKLSPPAP